MADGITRIGVEGFKSIAQRQEIEIAPLTILAGANSSGKSSIMQPLLMLKQTLEATYDPGPLKIDGPNITFTTADEFLWRTQAPSIRRLRVDLATREMGLDVTFSEGSSGLEVEEETHTFLESTVRLRPKMTSSELRQALSGFGPLEQMANQGFSVVE